MAPHNALILALVLVFLLQGFVRAQKFPTLPLVNQKIQGDIGGLMASELEKYQNYWTKPLFKYKYPTTTESSMIIFTKFSVLLTENVEFDGGGRSGVNFTTNSTHQMMEKLNSHLIDRFSNVTVGGGQTLVLILNLLVDFDLDR